MHRLYRLCNGVYIIYDRCYNDFCSHLVMGLGRATRLQQQHRVSSNVDDTTTKAWVTSKEVCLMYDVSILVGACVKFNRSTVQMLMSVLDSDGAKTD